MNIKMYFKSNNWVKISNFAIRQKRYFYAFLNVTMPFPCALRKVAIPFPVSCAVVNIVTSFPHKPWNQFSDSKLYSLI